jgi:hypothetical protein
MIDPRRVTNFDRTREELEEFMLFSIVVAGKNAFVQAKKLEEFLSKRQRYPDGSTYMGSPFCQSPFEYITEIDWNKQLTEKLRDVKMGQYERITSAFRGISHLFRYPLFKTDIALLECIKGIGMKTARFFAIHSRPNQRYACLDTHILQWLGERGHEVPKSTPRRQQYLDLEKIFLDYCDKMNMIPSELDLKIWNEKHI